MNSWKKIGLTITMVLLMICIVPFWILAMPYLLAGKLCDAISKYVDGKQ